jgi:uncharacterized membrane protein YhaH (DUF805 family)
MPSFRYLVLTTLEVLLHGSCLLAPYWISQVLSKSDSIITQVPEAIDDANNITKVGFAIHSFSIGEREDIEFSDEQEDALGDQHKAAKILYFVFTSFMWLALIVPVLMGAVHRWGPSKMDGRLVMSKMTRSLARMTIPVIVVSTILMAIPFVLLARSNLCGPNYMELRFQHQEMSAESENDLDFIYDDLEGTIAIVYEDIGASCELGRSGAATAIGLVVWPFLLLVQAFFLNSKANKLGTAFEKAKTHAAAAAAPGIEVNDKHNEEEDDATVDESHERDDHKRRKVPMLLEASPEVLLEASPNVFLLLLAAFF